MSEDRKASSRPSPSAAAVRHPTSDIRPLTSIVRSLSSDRVVIATHNPGKLAEMSELLAPYGIAAISAGELGLAEPDENGMTFTENACIKAVAAARAARLPALADDSGLVVEALDGAPGIHSARWAGPGPDRNFQRAMEAIEHQLRGRGATTSERRRAQFVSALCLAWPDGHTEQFEARVGGTLVWPPRGTFGFGYDPMFLPDGQQRTFGEMSSEEKHGLPPRGRGLSHRARAFIKLAEACLERC
jgi:XTP/dITP diphosphohydrolase